MKSSHRLFVLFRVFYFSGVRKHTQKSVFFPSVANDVVTPREEINPCLWRSHVVRERRGGEGEIRTRGTILAYDGFQVRCFRPLSHLSMVDGRIIKERRCFVEQRKAIKNLLEGRLDDERLVWGGVAVVFAPSTCVTADFCEAGVVDRAQPGERGIGVEEALEKGFDRDPVRDDQVERLLYAWIAIIEIVEERTHTRRDHAHGFATRWAMIHVGKIHRALMPWIAVDGVAWQSVPFATFDLAETLVDDRR